MPHKDGRAPPSGPPGPTSLLWGMGHPEKDLSQSGFLWSIHPERVGPRDAFTPLCPVAVWFTDEPLSPSLVLPNPWDTTTYGTSQVVPISHRRKVKADR